MATEKIEKFQIIKGDLLELAKTGCFDFIAHGCNCQKVMGAGIAAQIKQQFPIVYDADYEDTRLPIERLGDFTLATVGIEPNGTKSTVNVLNLYTQLNPGRDLYVNALRLCLQKVNLSYAGSRIGLPKIGCGIAGGNWDEVVEYIKKDLKDMYVTIVDYVPSLRMQEKERDFVR